MARRKRDKIGDKDRFEVFKRDKFQCQYCGASAPDVVLVVDHLEPHSKGGSDDLTNLVTACRDCNSGKSDRRVADDSAVKVQKKQLDDLQERRNQLELMAQWSAGILELRERGVEVLNALVQGRTGRDMAPGFAGEVSKMIAKHGFQCVLLAFQKSFDQNLAYRNDVKWPTLESGNAAANRIKFYLEPEWKQAARWCSAVMRNRFGFTFSDTENKACFTAARDAVKAGAQLDDIKRLATEAGDVDDFVGSCAYHEAAAARAG